MAADDEFEFEALQADLQLDLEDLSVEQLREYGRTLSVRAAAFDFDRPRRFQAALQVFVALRRMPGLNVGEAEDRFALWCEGFGLSADDCFREFERMAEHHKEERKAMEKGFSG
jgi:hypothetical protein